MESATTERRESKRYLMEVGVRVGHEHGRTRNLSSRGVYVIAPEPLEPGRPVEMDMTLTSASAHGPVTLHVRGHVTRVDQLGDELGLAVAIESWDVTDPGTAGFMA
jgi:hypothetical protein